MTQPCLPPELLGLIFREILPDDMGTDGRLQFQTLRMVCSKWRGTCFSTPHLWASLTLIPSDPILNSYADLLRAWFSKSGDSIPLSLALDHKYQIDSQMDDIVQLIQSLQGRWRYLALNINDLDFWRLLRISPREKWTNLSHLNIPCHIISIEDPVLGPEGDVVEDHPLDEVPPVKTMTLLTKYSRPEMIYPVIKDSVENLIWNAISLHYEDYSTFITKYRNLRTLDLRCETWDWYGQVHGTSAITLDVLRCFSFTGLILPTNFEIVQRFRTPALCELNLTLNEPPVDRNSVDGWGRGYEAPWLGDSTITGYVEGGGGGIRNENLIDSRFMKSTGLPYNALLKPLIASSRDSLTMVSIKVINLSLQYWPYATPFVNSLPIFLPSASIWLPKLEMMRIFEVPTPRMSQSLALEAISSLRSFVHGRLESAQGRARLRLLEVTRGGVAFFEDGELECMVGKGLKVTVWAKKF
ncbi:hypothetical protein BKA70DRAFT_1307457 [Coprinopsis sp. MPI-PUGE-AT-0042]|nr:hypothetical protein BKA70DRAFT_1307457 [Coprinopsis sp. MPI-PUGE-AT-0042]